MLGERSPPAPEWWCSPHGPSGHAACPPPQPPGHPQFHSGIAGQSYPWQLSDRSLSPLHIQRNRHISIIKIITIIIDTMMQGNLNGPL